MIITGKIVEQVEITAAGDVFHEFFAIRPHEVSAMSPDKIHGCDLHEGDWGKVGSIICWEFTHDGKKKSAREVIEALDEKNQIVKLRIIDGELKEQYKDILVTIEVKDHGDKHLVTWTMEYEKLNANIPDLVTLMELAIGITKDIESHHHGMK
ncbi:hypothetical protein Leryth_023798 [Lithospermum erythrorhizon]|nr:hypothetical protein Leryth_023798 [Lithospermum erythrorhizon]